jgi:hypothetical protein
MGGMYGSCWRDGQLLTDVVLVQGTADIQQVQVPLVGQTRMGFKPGRVTRSGNLRYQKVDGHWEKMVWDYISTTLEQRRAARDAGNPGLPNFDIQLEIDDPDALGIEKWTLTGCQIYRMSLGFDINQDLTEIDIPFTWEDETPVYLFTKDVNAAGVAVASWYPGYSPS